MDEDVGEEGDCSCCGVKDDVPAANKKERD